MRPRRYKNATEAANHLMSMTGVRPSLITPHIAEAVSLEIEGSVRYWLYVMVWTHYLPPVELSRHPDGSYSLIYVSPRSYAKHTRQVIKTRRHSFANQDTVPQD